MCTQGIILLSALWYNIHLSNMAYYLHKRAQTCSQLSQYHSSKEETFAVHLHSVSINFVASYLLAGPNRCLSPPISESKQHEHVQK